jgi:multidrug efflux system membrane fusion protein
VSFREGQDVREGDALFTIDARAYQAALQAAEANLAREKARALTAEADARRYDDLVAREYVTRQQSEQATATFEAAKATVEALEAEMANARLNLSYCTIRSPIAGRTGDVRVRAGNLVGPSDAAPLVTVNRIRPILVGFAVPEQRLSEIRAAAAAGPLAVTALPSGVAGEPLAGELVFLDNAVDSNTGTVLLKALFPNEDEVLWPGQFVNVRLRLRTLPNAVVIPASAVQSSQKGEFAYVVGADQTAQMRLVQLGPRLDGEVVITDGVAADETVVVDGQLRLTPGAKVSISSGLAPAGAPAK